MKVNEMISEDRNCNGHSVYNSHLPVAVAPTRPTFSSVMVSFERPPPPTKQQQQPSKAEIRPYASLTANESVLKTILMDRSLRKRPASPPRPAAAGIQQLPAAVVIQNGFQASAALLNSCPQ